MKFWLYLIFLIPSFLCSLFVVYHLLVYGRLRYNLYNHAILIVLVLGLIYEVTIYPWMLYYNHAEGVWERSLPFCTLWSFIDWGLYYTQTILFAWATIERHILIFHDRWVATRTKCFVIHYLPLIVLMLYCLIYYVVIDFFPPCENSYTNESMICVSLCLMHAHTPLHMWDTIAHQILPNVIIVTFSIALLVRIYWRKYRIGQSVQWRKHRKMTIQVLYISFLYLIFAFPMTLMNFLYLCSISRLFGADLMQYLLVLNYTMILLSPFACLLALPHFQNTWKNKFHLRRQRTATVKPLNGTRTNSLVFRLNAASLRMQSK